MEALTHGLRNHNILTGSLGSCQALLRKDIQLIFKPYELLHSYRYKQGYFLGTGIFSHSQLLRLHQFLAGQAKSLADPTVLDLFTTLGDRLQSSKISSLHPYPVRALYNFTITNQSYLPYWALEGIDLQRWIWGFKDQVQVVSPPEQVKRIREEVNAIGLLYGSDPLIDLIL